MEMKDSERLIESFKKRPVRTFCAILVFIVFLSGTAYLTGFFSEKGKLATGLSKEGSPMEQSYKDLRHKRKTTDPRPSINQRTEGEQSPAVNVAPGGEVIFNYGAPKERNTKE